MRKESIFVSIVSYRDPLLAETIKSVFEDSSKMFDIVVGVFEQIAKEDSLPIKHSEVFEKYKNQIRYKRIDPEYTSGAGWARAINAFQIQNEDYYYQIDSHMVFDPNWDRVLVKDYKRGREKFGTDKIIITAGTKLFNLNEEGKIEKETIARVTSRFRYFCFQSSWVVGAHGDYIDPQPDVTPAMHCSAGNFFTHADWNRNVGVNGRVYFDGEEQILTLSSFNAGYYLCHPTEVHVYHLKKTQEYLTKPWYQPVIGDRVHPEEMNKTFTELHNLINSMSDDEVEAYRKYCGVDYKNKKLEKRALTDSIRVDPSILPDTWTVEDRE